jgi:O-antigen ligase
MERSLLTKFLYFPGLLLLSMMIVVPSAYQLFKGILFIIVLIEIFIIINFRLSLKMHPNIFFLFIFYIFLGIAFGVYGLIQHNSGALPITKEIVLYVILYMIVICGIDDYVSMTYIHKTLILSLSFLCIYIAASLLNAYGIWPDSLYYNLQTTTSDQAINVTTLKLYGRFSASFSSYPSLLFLQPYLFVFLITNPKKQSKWMWLLFLVSTAIMVFVGRRILLMVALLFPLFTILFISFIRKDNEHKVVKWKSVLFYLVIFFVVISIIFIEVSGVSIKSITDYFISNFHSKQVTTGGKVGSNVRLDTIIELFKGWKERPLFGFGSGAYYPHFIRNLKEPWNYEVSYMQYLYSWGIAGCALYGMGIYFIIRKLINIYKEGSFYSSYALASLMGMIAFLIGNATNPYLLKIDYFFVIFLPVAIINLHYREH